MGKPVSVKPIRPAVISVLLVSYFVGKANLTSPSVLTGDPSDWCKPIVMPAVRKGSS